MEKTTMNETLTRKEKTLFAQDTNPSNIMPAKLTLGSAIRFRCHPGVSCFTACCGNVNIVLTPYDILCLRRRLGISSDEFLLAFTRPVFLEKTDMPGVQLKLDENGRCPFVRDNGCILYTDRPSACRYYPVGMANFHEGAQENQTAERFFFLVKEPHCKGHEEDTTWTVEEWRKDQGVDVRDEMNRGWMELVMRRKSFGIQATLSEPAQKIFFMASTNLEKFRVFIFESSFLDTYEIEQETLDRIREDDVELMKFSYLYLASSLFGTKDLKIREDKIQAKVAELKEKQQEKARQAEETYEELKKERDELQKAIDARKKTPSH